MSDWQANNTFDPYTQPFLLIAPDGTTPVTAFMSQLLSLQYLATTQGIIFGVQTGLTGLLFIILVLMTKRDKRRYACNFAIQNLTPNLLAIPSTKRASTAIQTERAA